MRVLTVRQPWAGLIMHGVKTVENRGWRPPGDLRIGIHAAQRLDRDADVVLPNRIPYDLGVILGTVFVSGHHVAGGPDCRCTVEEYAEFPIVDVGFPRMYHWRLVRPRRFVTPIPARGALGLWAPGPSAAHLMEIAEVVR